MPPNLGLHGNVVRRGLVPLVMGLCLGFMAWLSAAKELSRKRAASCDGPSQPTLEWCASRRHPKAGL